MVYYHPHYTTVGGLEPWNGLWLSRNSWEFHHPNWRSPWFFREVGVPPTSSNQIIEKTYLIPMKIMKNCNELWQTYVNMAASLSHINDCLYIPQFMLRWLIIVIECYRSKFDSPTCWWLYQSYHLFSETFIVEQSEKWWKIGVHWTMMKVSPFFQWLMISPTIEWYPLVN